MTGDINDGLVPFKPHRADRRRAQHDRLLRLPIGNQCDPFGIHEQQFIQTVGQYPVGMDMEPQAIHFQVTQRVRLCRDTQSQHGIHIRLRIQKIITIC